MWYFIGRTLSWIFLHSVVWLRVVGKDKIRAARKRGGLMIVANHNSYLDPPIFGVAFHKPIAFVARKTLFKKGFWGWIYPRLQAIPIDQDNADLSSMRLIISELKKGRTVLIFPEGVRSPTGELGEAQPGVGLIVAKAKVPVFPMRAFGAYEAMPRGSSFPKLFSRVTAVAGDMIEFTDEELAVRGREGYKQLSDRLMEAIEAIEEPV